jgi:GTP-binding protein HflX
LEEAAQADLILHVVDASHPDPEGQIQAVRTVLADVPGASDVKEVLVLNKCDAAPGDVLTRLRARREVTVEISALTGAGIADLLDTVQRELPEPAERVALTVPYSRGDLLAEAHRSGTVLSELHSAEGTELVALVDPSLAARLRAAADAA